MDLQEALDTLGERDAKKILSNMFQSLVTLNTNWNTRHPWPAYVKGEFVSCIPSQAEKFAQELGNSAYTILKEEGFNNPNRWLKDIYNKNMHVNPKVTISDMIEKLREYRADRVAHIIIQPHEVPNGAKVLDYGIGNGLNMLELLRGRPDITIHGYDPYENVCQNLKESDQYKHIHSLDDLDSDYDFAISSWVLHHAPQEKHQKIFDMIREHLKPSGNFILIETILHDPDISPCTPESLKYLHAEALLKDIVSGNGMRIGEPRNLNDVSGYHHAEHWANMLTLSGFDVDTFSAYLDDNHDEFKEKSFVARCTPI